VELRVPCTSIQTQITPHKNNFIFSIFDIIFCIVAVDFKKAHVSVRREVLYNILIEFVVPLKLVRLINMCLNETSSKVRIGKHLSDNFLVQKSLKQGDALSPLFSTSL
jgi:uncharacterized membrane protein YagU involved in acid resistance